MSTLAFMQDVSDRPADSVEALPFHGIVQELDYFGSIRFGVSSASPGPFS